MLRARTAYGQEIQRGHDLAFTMAALCDTSAPIHASGSTYRSRLQTTQCPRKRQEHDQSYDRDNDHHDDYFWVTEALARDYQRCGNVALARTECHHSFRSRIRSAE